MRTRPALVVLCTALAVCLLVAAVVAQRQTRKGSLAVFEFDTFKVDLKSGETVLMGNCVADIKGDYTAHMTASALTLTPDKQKSKVVSFEARGPVHFDVTMVDDDGTKLHVDARCSDRATFSEQTQLAELVGNVTADVSGVPGVEDLEGLKLEGPRLTVNLAEKSITGAQRTRLEAQMAPPKPAAEESQ